jgi:hypothetical protein
VLLALPKDDRRKRWEKRKRKKGEKYKGAERKEEIIILTTSVFWECGKTVITTKNHLQLPTLSSQIPCSHL